MALTYKVILLSKEESKDVDNLGYKFAKENETRWKDMGIEAPESEISTYDYGTTYLVYDDVVYTIFKDYIIPDKGVRLFILKNRALETDMAKKE